MRTPNTALVGAIPEIPGYRIVSALNVLAWQRVEPRTMDDAAFARWLKRNAYCVHMRGSCWLATRRDRSEPVRIQRFDRLSKAQLERWQETVELIEAHILDPCPYVAPIDALERDAEGVWYTVTRWIDGHPVVEADDAVPGWSREGVLRVLWTVAQALVWAAGLQERAGLASPVVHGLLDGSEVLSTDAKETIVTGFDQAFVRGVPFDVRTRRVLYHTVAPEVAERGAWSPASDVFMLGHFARPLLRSARRTRFVQNLPPDPRLEALTALTDRCRAPDAARRPSAEDVVRGLEALMDGPVAPHLCALDFSGALAWLRARVAEDATPSLHVEHTLRLERAAHLAETPRDAVARVDMVAGAFALRPELKQAQVARDYVWHHLGGALLGPVSRGAVTPSRWVGLMRWLPEVVPALGRLLEAPGASDGTKAEAVRVLGVLGSAPARAVLQSASGVPCSPLARWRIQASLDPAASRADAVVGDDDIQARLGPAVWVTFEGQRWRLRPGERIVIGSGAGSDVHMPGEMLVVLVALEGGGVEAWPMHARSKRYVATPELPLWSFVDAKGRARREPVFCANATVYVRVNRAPHGLTVNLTKLVLQGEG